MNIPSAPTHYSQANEASFRNSVNQADGENFKTTKDVELKPNQRLIMRSANGTRWSITIDNTGAITTVSL